MAPSAQPRRGTLLGRVLLASLVWLAALSALLALAPRAGAAVRPGDDAVWAWPLDPLPRVLRPFDPPQSRYGAGHRGIDLLSSPGRSVLAVADGVVTHSGVVAGRGTVTVRHGSGVASTYEPLDDRIAEGAVVQAHDVLGTIGPAAHCEPASCLHLGARLGEEYLDPLLLLTRVRIVLLPLPDSPG